jgi:hypothetical protein
MKRDIFMACWGTGKSWAGTHIVTKEFGILGCHKRDDTFQKSIDKAKFISEK